MTDVSTRFGLFRIIDFSPDQFRNMQLHWRLSCSISVKLFAIASLTLLYVAPV